MATDLMEVGLDAIMEDGLIKDIPIFSTAISLYKIGQSIKDRHQLRKMAAFVAALNDGIADDKQREYYKNAVKDDPKRRNKELEYILILIDRYIHLDKAENLAKLYLAYFDKKINWVVFCQYAEVLDRFLPEDFQALQEIEQGISVRPDLRLRLSALGLVTQIEKHPEFTINQGILSQSQEDNEYVLTEFGLLFEGILVNNTDQ